MTHVQWEYLELTDFGQDLLNDLGLQGWEVMGSSHRPREITESRGSKWVLLKRAKDEARDPAQKTLDDFQFKLGYPTQPMWDAYYAILSADCVVEEVKEAARAEKSNGCHWQGPGDNVSGGQAFLPMILCAHEDASQAGDAETQRILEKGMADLRTRYGGSSCSAAVRWMVAAKGSAMWNEALAPLKSRPAVWGQLVG